MLLKKGQRFTVFGQRWKVSYVNASRAHCVCVEKEIVTVTDKTGADRTFEATRRRSMDVSPNTNVDLLQEVCP